MGLKRFLSFNVFGSVGWVISMTVLGHQLGSVPFVRAHFEKVLILIIGVSLMPALSHAWKAYRDRSSVKTGTSTAD